MNNKGQSLIFFVVILPILALFLVFLIDICIYGLNNNHIKNTIKDNLKVILKDEIKDEDKIIKVIKDNIDDINVDVRILENGIEINVNYKHKSFSKKLISSEPTVNYHYCGNYESKEIKNKKCN